jgi:hypothetical protein
MEEEVVLSGGDYTGLRLGNAISHRDDLKKIIVVDVSSIIASCARNAYAASLRR